MTNTSDNNDTVISDTEIRLLISSQETNRDDNSHDNETATSTTNFTGKKLRALVAAAFTIVLLISLSIYHRYDNGLSCKPGQQFGKRGDESDYACPDSTGATIDSITLLWGGVSVKFSKHKVIRWNTPTADIVNFVSKDLKGPVLSVLHTTGKCEKGSERPGENFYMCGPLNGIAGTACGLSSPTCGRHSHADYSNTGWDKGHMITSHEGGLFADGEQQTFSMCNIWPQGKQFNERWWQHLEFTCDGYAIDKETLILSGPIFANGTNNCMGEFDDSHGSATQLTTGPIVLCDSVRPKGAPESPIPIPSNFFKILVDLKKKIYWVFLATNDAGPVEEEQLVPDMLSTLTTVKNMSGLMAEVDLSGYEEQSDVLCFNEDSSSPKCNTTSTLKVAHTVPDCLY